MTRYETIIDLYKWYKIMFPDPARYLFVRLFSRKNGWFRVSRIGYHDELVDVQAAVDEICETTAEVPYTSASCKPEEEGRADQTPEAGPPNTPGILSVASCSPQEIDNSGIILIASDIEEEEEEVSTDRKGRKTSNSRKEQNLIDPLSNRSIKEVKKEIQDFGLSRFAINERILAERNDIDELLRLLSVDELKVSNCIRSRVFIRQADVRSQLSTGSGERATYTFKHHDTSNDH